MAEDVILTDLVVRDFDTLEEFNKHVGEIGGNDIVFTPDTTAKLWLFYRATSERIVNEMSWLRADTFSWHSGDVYVAAYEHLVGGLKPLYAWVDRAGSYGFNVFTESETPAVGDTVYGENGLAVGTCSSYNGMALAWTGSDGTAYSAWLRETSSDFPKQKTETIEGISIVCNVTPDGLKICLPDQESNIVALYEKVGSANYFILDETNKQFKLPRTVQRKLIRAYKNGTTWYNLYSDGWVEQGGELASIAKDTTTTIPLPIPFVDTDYSVGIIATGGVREGTQYTNGQTVQSKATDSFVMMARDYTFGRIWSACGYARTTADMGIEHEYYYVGNFEQSAIEQTAGITAETLNGKADIDLGNLADGGKEIVANMAMPSDRYVDLTLGATDSSYTAPADGYVVFGKRVGGNTTQFNCLKTPGNVSRIESANAVSGFWATVMMPVKKGQVFQVEYNTTGTVAIFRFVYANGAK